MLLCAWETLPQTLRRVLAAVGVERVLHDPLRRVPLVIVAKAQVSSSLGKGLPTGVFGTLPQSVVGVRAVAGKALHDNYLPVLWISRGALARGLSRMNRGLAPGG